MSDVSSSKSVWPTAVAVIGVFAIFLLILVIAYRPPVALDQISSAPEEEAWKLSAEGRAARLIEMRGQAKTEATSYKWLDQEAGLVQLPIEQAVKLTIAELNAQP